MEKYIPFLVLILAIARGVFCDGSSSDDLYKPCEFNDVACVRKYFSKNSKCSVISKENDNPSYEVNLPIYVPKINLTAVSTETHISNLNGTIETFYMDKKTGNLVMSVKFEGLSVYAPDVIFAVSQRGKEPRVLREDLKATYPMILTAVIPASNGITNESLKHGEYLAYFPENNMNVVPGPKFSNSGDPVVSASVAAFLADVPSAVLEVFHTKASFDFLVYLQNYICDFGLSPVITNYDTTALLSIYRMNDDNEDRKREPCSSGDDAIECVINFFDEFADCTVVSQPSDKPVSRDRVDIYVPKINSTVIPINSTLSGLNSDIESFYINGQTGNLVMTVKFDNITMTAPMTHLVINRVGEEPTVISGYDTVSYAPTLTAVIPISLGLTPEAIEKAFVTAYISEPMSFNLAPTFTKSKDPLVKKLLEEVPPNLTTITQEILVTEAPNFFLGYLQKYICDFRLPNNLFYL